jgi:four helix bundle protein
MYMSKLADVDGEATETQVWLNFARDCKYLDPNQQAKLQQRYEEVGRMIGKMMSMPEKFIPTNQRREE